MRAELPDAPRARRLKIFRGPAAGQFDDGIAATVDWYRAHADHLREVG